jgi:predicted dehydrogenase
MNILILGDGPEELRWARALLDHPEHRLAYACPGFKSLPDVPGGNDLDTALASSRLDAVICGGDPTLRAEGLRRAASTGLRAIALHPPGPNADPYYQVALSRQENGAIVVPDLPARLHPGVATLEKALRDDPGKTSRVVRYDATVGPTDGDLMRVVLPKVLDVVRALIGEVQAVTATAAPSGESLTVHLRTATDLHAEIRLARGPHEPARLTVPAGDGTLTLEHDISFDGPARLVRKSTKEGESGIELGPWDAKAAILRALEEADPSGEATPGLGDGTRAMEVAEAAARSLRKGRTIDLHYEEMSEVGNFKSVMTSTGCALLLIAMVLLFASAALPWMGFEKGAYIAWVVPPALVLFMLFQFLRYGIKSPGQRA